MSHSEMQLEYINLAGNKIISSNSSRDLRRKGINPGRQKFTISIDNIRLVGFRLFEDDPEFTEDTFEIVHAYLKDSFFSRESMRVWNELKHVLTREKRSSIIELRFGTYEVEPINGRKGGVRS